MRSGAWVLIPILAAAGCARAPERSQDLDPGEERLIRTLDASNRAPSTWSPVVTVPLYPVLLAANATIDVARATFLYVRNLLGGGPAEPPAVPERLEKQAEQLRRN